MPITDNHPGKFNLSLTGSECIASGLWPEGDPLAAGFLDSVQVRLDEVEFAGLGLEKGICHYLYTHARSPIGLLTTVRAVDVAGSANTIQARAARVLYRRERGRDLDYADLGPGLRSLDDLAPLTVLFLLGLYEDYADPDEDISIDDMDAILAPTALVLDDFYRD